MISLAQRTLSMHAAMFAASLRAAMITETWVSAMANYRLEAIDHRGLGKLSRDA